MRRIRLALACLLVLALALPAAAAGEHLDPGTLVAGDGADDAVLVHLHVPSGHKEAQSVYVVQRVARCADPDGPGWYGTSAARQVRSAPELEMRERLGAICSCQLPLPTTCASAARARPAGVSGWDRLVSGTFEPFAPIEFPPFGA
jgi:hypothetical protein